METPLEVYSLYISVYDKKSESFGTQLHTS